jgi:hypothetical protein
MKTRISIACLTLAILLPVVAFAPSAGAGTGADGSTYVLTSFDGISLLGLNDQGRTFTAQFAGTTSFKSAQLDKYHPGDPYRTACAAAAANYNGALTIATSDGGVARDAALGSLASLGCKARLLLDTKSVPPNPIKSFQPVA